MQPSEVARRRDKTTEDAFGLFEAHPDFPRVQVRMRDRMEEATGNLSPDARAFGSKARLEYVLSLFNIRADSLLGLVSDIRAQNAFMVVLDSLERDAWEEYTGWPIEVMRPASAEADADLATIHKRVKRWTYNGYKRLESLRKTQGESEGGPAAKADMVAPVHAATASFPARASWLKERLRERAWNKHDLSRQGGPDNKTVQKVLDGFRVREDVLQKIADALSKRRGAVTVIDIPQD